MSCRVSPAVAALVAGLSLSLAAEARAQAPVTAEPDPVTLEEVVVEGRPLTALTREFVAEVGAPPPRRGLARWRGRPCIGVANVDTALAQPLIDHVSRMAMDYGLRPGDPGCDANVLIAFTNDAGQLAQAMVESHRRTFRLGVGGLDRGNPALRAFQENPAPVRWWHVSMPINAETGRPGIRLPGYTAPYVTGEGLVNQGRWIRDDLQRVFIVVQMSDVEGLSLTQLGDYLGFLTLAQVDPDAATASYASILNLFDDPDTNVGLTDWDRAYLDALYSGPSQRIRDGEQTYQLLRNLREERAELAPED